MEFLIIIFFNRWYFLPDVCELPDLVLNLVLEKTHLVFQIVDAKFIEHAHLVIAVVTEEALEANGAQTVLAESLDFFCWMYLAATLLELPDLVIHEGPL